MATDTLILDTNAKRLELLQLWQDTFDICKAFVAEAKASPAKISASMLKEIVGLLKQSTSVLDLMQAAQERAEAEEAKAENDGMTEEEAKMLEEFDEMQQQIDLGGGENPRPQSYAEFESGKAGRIQNPQAAGFAEDDLSSWARAGKRRQY